MQTTYRGMVIAFAAAVAFAALPAHAQCPASEAYNGNEPPEFTHCTDLDDASGNCRSDAVPVNGVFPNGPYPTCTCPDGTPQVGHQHWEYTHLQTDTTANGQSNETEEKDYLNNEDSNGDTAGQAARFLANEPKRFDRALRPSSNPTGRYWQVDEWIGPGMNGDKVPLLTWTERFFECSGLGPCATIDGMDAVGGYWSNQREQVDPTTECGDALGASPDPARSPKCGIVFRPCSVGY